jgi:cold shock CspA family protein
VKGLEIVWADQKTTEKESAMTGVMKRILDKGFGFIEADGNGKEYFVHASDFVGDWLELKDEVQAGKRVKLSFEVATSTKGPRAAGVRRIET